MKSSNSLSEYWKYCQKAVKYLAVCEKSLGQFPRLRTNWDLVKSAGVSAIPSGDASVSFQRLSPELKRMGIWIVPVGELESFCKSVPGKGSRWVREIIKNFNIEFDSEFQSARDFMRELWHYGANN